MASGFNGSRQLNQTLSSAISRTTTGLSLQGDILAETDGKRVTTLFLDVTTSAGGGGVSLDDRAPLGRTIVAYNDDTTLLTEMPYIVHWLRSDGDTMLEPGELAQIAVDLSPVDPPIGGSHTFTLQVKPLDANYLIIERTTPGGSSLNRFITLR
jgi:archaellin